MSPRSYSIRAIIFGAMGHHATAVLASITGSAPGGWATERRGDEAASALLVLGASLRRRRFPMTTELDSTQMSTIPPLTMPLEEAMRTQRAIRRLRPDPIDDGLVLRLIELALKAPTGLNAQNWEFVMVKDRQVKARLARLNRLAWSIYGRIGRRLMANEPKMQRLLDAVQYQADHFEDAPVLVVACLRGLRLLWPPLAVTSYYGSIHPSVQNLLLAARAAGLGATLTTLPLWSTWLARRVLGLPWRVTPCAVVPLGWPIGRYGPTTRRAVGEVVHLDRYGHQPFKGQAMG
jgi:nitroreductase